MTASRWRIILLVAVGLAGCARAVSAHDKAFYLAHDGNRGRELAACRSDPGGLGGTPDCVNANAADHEVETRRFLSTEPTSSRLAHPGAL